MTVHVLKTDAAPFAALWDGSKAFEFRRNDRGYSVGDTLVLQERTDDGFTGRCVVAAVTYALADGYGVPDGFAVLSIRETGRSDGRVGDGEGLWPCWIRDNDGDWCLSTDAKGYAAREWVDTPRPRGGEWCEAWDAHGRPKFANDVEARLWVQRNFPDARPKGDA